MRQSIIFILYLLCTFTARSQSALTPEQTGSIYYAYPVPSSTYTPAPTGYEPFYISHYGRHGSRWMTADERYTEVICVFDSLYQCSELTPLGVDVREVCIRFGKMPADVVEVSPHLASASTVR